MELEANLLTHGSFFGPSVLDLLARHANQPTEIAALHSSNHSGPSVVAVNAVLTMEIDHRGKARWVAHPDLHAPELPISADPLHAWQQMLDSVLLTSQEPLPLVGWIGGISYDIGRHIENIGNAARNDDPWPLIRFTLFDQYFLFDPASSQWTLASWEWNQPHKQSAAAQLAQMEKTLAAVKPAPEKPVVPGKIVAQVSRDVYCDNVRRTRDYIAAGDIYQANIAQRWTVKTAANPADIYSRLCALNPSAYGAFLRFDNHAVLSASPELFLDRRGNHLVTRPIKGTRPRDLADPRRDEQFKTELLESAKDRAELAMIVDLLRNDLGRICSYGSVKVSHPREVEKLPTLWHTFAQVEGKLAEATQGWSTVIRALCPGGSITGAPKIRSMQIIETLEPVCRGWYCGNIGWLGPEGNGMLNIAIRTILMREEGQKKPAWLAQVWAGAGIVADSQEESEYQETLTKARALLAALGIS